VARALEYNLLQRVTMAPSYPMSTLPLVMIILAGLTSQSEASTSSSTTHHRRLRDAPSVQRRLSACGWCVHGSRSWFRCNCEDGWEGRCCDTRIELHDGKNFELHRIKNNEVEHQLAFAKTGSELPSSLHGIFWMDQRGVNVPAATGPDYQQVGDTAADELLVSFGETYWDPVTRCAGPVPTYGGKQGHWTFMDQKGLPGEGQSAEWSTLYSNRLYLDFCFRSDKFEEIDIHVHIKKLGLWIRVPWFGMHLTMTKMKWGWDRQTTAFISNDVFHYPVFQIVDGEGKRTEHYEAYLKWANNQQSTDHPATPINNGEGTSLVGRLAE